MLPQLKFLFAISLFLLVFSPEKTSAQPFRDASELLHTRNSTLGFVWGASAVDINNDGRVDLYRKGQLFIQQEDGTFLDIMPVSGLQADEGTTVFGGIFGDVDDDGDLDLFVEDLDPGALFARNQLGQWFKPDVAGSNIEVSALTQGSVWGDYNADGLLDLFVGSDDGKNQLFVNQGSGRFRDWTANAGITFDRNTYGVAASDYDRDGDLDLFISACEPVNAARSVNILLRNDGNLHFTDVAPEVGLADSMASWGVVWLDFNNDGWMDLYVTAMPTVDRSGQNKLYRNNGQAGFEDVTDRAGVGGNPQHASFGVAAADFNNDGWVDLYVTNQGQSHQLYRNNADGTFADVGSGFSPLSPIGVGVAVADLNADGRIDLFLPSDTGNQLLLNESQSNNWITIKTRSRRSNHYGVGAQVELYTSEGMQMREITGGDGMTSQNHDLSAHFGLGSVAMIDSVIVYWPGGERTQVRNVNINRSVTIVEGRGLNRPPSTFRLRLPADSVGFAPDRSSVRFVWETSVDPDGDPLVYALRIAGTGASSNFVGITGTDFTVPSARISNHDGDAWTVTVSDGYSVRNSRDVFVLGPPPLAEPVLPPYGIRAFEFGSIDLDDYDGDGDLDLVTTGRIGTQAATRLYRLEDSTFAIGQNNFSVKVFRPRTPNTVVNVWRGATAWGDYDNDGDRDLLLTGILTFESTQTGLQIIPITRIYDVTADTVFVERQPGIVGVHSGAVDWGDFDNDGDLDLLIAGATSPEPPLNPVTRIYRNNGNGSFTDTDIELPGIMLGTAKWGDYDADGDLDLVLMGDLGAGYLTRVYRNDGDRIFTEIESPFPDLAFGSADWGDFDDDGDLDLLMAGAAFAPTLVEGVSRVYRNDGNDLFKELDQELVGLAMGKARWGDYDADGQLDLFLFGAESAYGERRFIVYRNANGRFQQLFRLGGGVFGDMAVGDHNGDGDTDFVIQGQGGDGNLFLSFFMNRIIPEPVPPSFLTRR